MAESSEEKGRKHIRVPGKIKPDSPLYRILQEIAKEVVERLHKDGAEKVAAHTDDGSEKVVFDAKKDFGGS